jgi:hypothetical protein
MAYVADAVSADAVTLSSTMRTGGFELGSSALTSSTLKWLQRIQCGFNIIALGLGIGPRLAIGLPAVRAVLAFALADYFCPCMLKTPGTLNFQRTSLFVCWSIVLSLGYLIPD